VLTKYITIILATLIFSFTAGCTRKNTSLTVQNIPDTCVNKVSISKKIVDIDSNAKVKHKEILPRKVLTTNINGKSYCYLFGTNGIVYLSKTELLLNKSNIDSLKNITINSSIFTYHNQVYEYDYKKRQLFDLSTNAFVDSFYSIGKFSEFTSFSNSARAKLIQVNNSYGFIDNYQPVKVLNKNFIDTTPLIIFYNKTYKKIGAYPKEFFKKRIEFNETFFDVDSSNNIYYVHESFDSIYKIDSYGKVLAQSVINPSIIRPEFPNSKNGDLAFLRKFESESDRNMSVSIWNNKYILVIKKLAKEKIVDNTRLKLYVYDTNLNKLFCDIMDENIVPFPVNNTKGFIFFTNSLKKIVSYEIN
jgi:hypothetical protein